MLQNMLYCKGEVQVNPDWIAFCLITLLLFNDSYKCIVLHGHIQLGFTEALLQSEVHSCDSHLTQWSAGEATGHLWRVLHQSCCVFGDRSCVLWVRLLWHRATPDRTAVAQGPNNQMKLEAGAFVIAKQAR